MNSFATGAVQRRSPGTARVIAIAFGALAALFGNLACVEINGGAVELSWTLRDFDGDTTNCGEQRIGSIRVCWQGLAGDAGLPGDVGCVAVSTEAGFREQYREFDCLASRGVTRFEIPAGRTALFVEPVCNGGTPPQGPYQVPPPIVRVVEEGQVVTLNQLLIVVTDKDTSADPTCPKPD